MVNTRWAWTWVALLCTGLGHWARWGLLEWAGVALFALIGVDSAVRYAEEEHYTGEAHRGCSVCGECSDCDLCPCLDGGTHSLLDPHAGEGL